MMSSSNKPPVSRIVELAQAIADATSKLDGFLAAKNLPSPSFDENAPVNAIPEDLWGLQDVVLDATAELHDLLLEPLHLVKHHSASNNSVSMQAIARYRIATLIPANGQVSFAQLGEKTGLGEQMVRRLLRHAMTMRVFREAEPGMVAHTQASRLLANEQMIAWTRIGTEEMWPAATKMIDALAEWPQSSEPNQTGFSLSQNSTKSIYDIISGSPERAGRFADAMGVWASRPDYSPSFAVDGYDWASLLGDDESRRIRVVDVGGAHGHVAAAIAQRYPRLDILVQDMDKVIEGVDLAAHGELVSQGRLKFMAYDLFSPQTAEADVFFFRWILHNWADQYCIAILKAQITALAKGARIIIMDSCMPDPENRGNEDNLALPLWKEKDLRAEDLNMGAVFNSQERTLNEWKNLLAKADPRFVLNKVTKPKGSALALIEVLWEPTPSK